MLNEPITERAWKLMDVPKRYPAVSQELAAGSGPNTPEFPADHRKIPLHLLDILFIMLPDICQISIQFLDKGWIGWDSWDLGRCVDFGWFPAV